MRAFIKQHTSDADFQQWDKVYQQAVPYYLSSSGTKSISRQCPTTVCPWHGRPYTIH